VMIPVLISMRYNFCTRGTPADTNMAIAHGSKVAEQHQERWTVETAPRSTEQCQVLSIHSMGCMATSASSKQCCAAAWGLR
jgi:hypothetical protein